MMEFVAGFVFGLLLGAPAGFFCFGLVASAHDADEQLEEFREANSATEELWGKMPERYIDGEERRDE